MVVLTRPSARKTIAARSTPKVIEEDKKSKLMYLSDVAAGRESTHQDAAPMTPVKRVMFTYELCEMVLDCLPLLDLLCTKRICRSVKNTIASSSKLQATHSLAPSGPTAASKFVSNVFGYHELVIMNKHLDIENLPPRAYASCRTMFVSQPPVKEVLLDIRGRVLCPTSSHCRGPRNNWHFLTVSTPTIRNEAGVRFGKVVDAVRQGLKGTWDGQLWNMRFVGGLPVTVEQKAFVDADGEATKETDLLAKS
ncbi:hypothetical protein B0A55_10212 [Friedmanniomyces simplex]|uniref:F-box domain-containing protein n=1 Tax=Friedmanniomyces simplex TaxID=329884 RepID=A0A4U0WP96_9PEZI|nr:hypothetical protein B0A55_10212 [Friedmanniomyces simplex]